MRHSCKGVVNGRAVLALVACFYSGLRGGYSRGVPLRVCEIYRQRSWYAARRHDSAVRPGVAWGAQAGCAKERPMVEPPPRPDAAPLRLRRPNREAQG